MDRSLLHVHHDETGCVPYLVCKVAACLNSLPVETHVVARCITGDQGHTQGICTVLVDHLQRIDTVAQGLTHLTALAVTHQTMDQYGIERAFSGLLITGEYHTDNPEEDDIVTGYQHIRRIEIFQFFGLLRPAQGRKRPQGRGEPGIQGVLILL